MIHEVSLPLGLRALRSLAFPHKLGVLERLYGRILARKGVCWIETSNDVFWKLDMTDPTQRWIVYGDYEGPAQMAWLRDWLGHGGVVIDSGANIGQMAIFLGGLPDVRLFAFEPLSATADWLEECLGNYPGWDAMVVRKGLSEIDGIVEIQEDGARSTMRMDWYSGKVLAKTPVAVTSFDSFCTETGIERIRLWKLDVEGHELEALRGALGNLQGKRIDAALIEISSSTCDAVLQCLQAVGYSTYKISGGGTLIPFERRSAGNENVVALPRTDRDR